MQLFLSKSKLSSQGRTSILIRHSQRNLTSQTSPSSPRYNSPYLSSSVNVTVVDVCYALGSSVYLVHAFSFLCSKGRHLKLHQLSFRSESLCFPQVCCPQDHWIQYLACSVLPLSEDLNRWFAIPRAMSWKVIYKYSLLSEFLKNNLCLTQIIVHEA